MMKLLALLASTTTVAGQMVTNGDFSADEIPTSPGYVSMNPAGWEDSNGNIRIVRNGNNAWGGLDSGGGTNFIAIQRSGTTLRQTLTDLMPGASYTVNFLVTHRPGYGEDETIHVSIDGDPIWESNHPPDTFTAVEAAFTATATSHVLAFANDSPDGDKSVFVDEVSVVAVIFPVVASDPPEGLNETPPEGLNAARRPWWPLRSDRRLEPDPGCSGGSTATRWRVVVTESAPCEDGSEECPLPGISFGDDGDGGGRLETACLEEPQTEAECAAAAQAAGLALGGAGHLFAGDYQTQGCYSYSSGTYEGMAYWSATGTNSLSPPAFRVCVARSSAKPDGVEFELAEPGPPGTVLISPGSSGGSEERWPLALDVEYHDGQADSRWRFYSRVTELMRPVPEDVVTVTLRGDDNRCYTEIERPSRVSANNRHASCDSGKGEWVEAEGVQICCRKEALWCHKAISTARKDLATSDVTPPTPDGRERWASGERGHGPKLSPGVMYRRWDDVHGSTIDQLLADPNFVDTAPTFQDVILDFFATPSNVCDRCASELSGYFLAPVTGDYTFKMTSDDAGELYLGESDTDTAPGIIARVSGWASPQQWSAQPGQTSEPLRLIAQTHYSIRGISNEGSGGDHLKVGVILPDGTSLLPIPVDGYIFHEE